MFTNPEFLLNTDIGAICADNVSVLRSMHLSQLRSKQVKFQRDAIKLVVFYLDGVLVDSKDLHFEEFNQALLQVAGHDFVISLDQHILIYDGLSTQQ